MAITYYEQYKNRKLNQMVLLGSHDAEGAIAGVRRCVRATGDA